MTEISIHKQTGDFQIQNYLYSLFTLKSTNTILQIFHIPIKTNYEIEFIASLLK